MNNIPMPTLDELLKAMEKMYEPQEEAWAFAQFLFYFQEICPVHQVGARDLELQRYVCPVCRTVLARTQR